MGGGAINAYQTNFSHSYSRYAWVLKRMKDSMEKVIKKKGIIYLEEYNTKVNNTYVSNLCLQDMAEMTEK